MSRWNFTVTSFRVKHWFAELPAVLLNETLAAYRTRGTDVTPKDPIASSATTVSETAPDAGPSNAQAPSVASRVVDLLGLVGRQDGGVGAREAERITGIDRSAVSRIFRQLEQLGWAQQVDDRGTYTAGPEFFAAAAAVRRRDSLWRAAEPFLVRLAAQFDETTYIAIRRGDHVLFKHKMESTQRIRYVLELDELHPLTTGAAGRAILSALSTEVVELVIAQGLTAYTPESITDPEQYREQLATDARLGYAYSRSGWVEGGAGVGSPFFDSSGECVGALTLSAPIKRLTSKAARTVGPAVRDAARDLSRRLGYSDEHWGSGT